MCHERPQLDAIMINIGNLYDVYQFISKDLIDITTRCVKELILKEFTRTFVCYVTV